MGLPVFLQKASPHTSVAGLRLHNLPNWANWSHSIVVFHRSWRELKTLDPSSDKQKLPVWLTRYLFPTTGEGVKVMFRKDKMTGRECGPLGILNSKVYSILVVWLCESGKSQSRFGFCNQNTKESSQWTLSTNITGSSLNDTFAFYKGFLYTSNWLRGQNFKIIIHHTP